MARHPSGWQLLTHPFAALVYAFVILAGIMLAGMAIAVLAALLLLGKLGQLAWRRAQRRRLGRDSLPHR